MQSSNKNYLRLLQATGILVVFASLLLFLGPVSVQAINSSSDATIGTNLSALSVGGCSGTPVTIGNDTVYFDGVRYDYPIPGQSTWYYCVESGRRPSISHITYDLNLTGEGGCQTIADNGTWGPSQDDLNSGAGIPVTGNDPTTSIYGLKFDQGFSDNEVRNYYFTINGNLATEDVTVATKAGRGFDIGFVSGPSAVCEEEGSSEPPVVNEPEFSDDDLAKMCFAISDGYFDENGDQQRDGGADDTLGYLNRLTGQTASVDGVVPNIATRNIEGMAFSPGGDTLYAANANVLGTVDLTNGDFTPVAFDGAGDPVEFGVGEGYYESSGGMRDETFNDVDSLTFDVITGVLWGVERSGSRPDMLIQIDPATGLYVPDLFNNPDPSPSGGDPAMVDYLQVEWQDGLKDIDDIASHPITGELYAIMNQGGGPSKLVIIDTTNGSTTEVGWYTRADTGEVISDMEGLAFFNDGRLYGSTGKDFNDLNVLWQIDTATAVATSVGEFTDRMIDIEALGCLTAPGFVAIEKSTNGVDADDTPGPYIETGDVVTWDYFVRNTGGRTLYNVVVTDDQEGEICTIDELDVGQSNVDAAVTCQATGTAGSGQYANMATVTGNDSPDGESGTEYSDDDPSHYYGYTPAAVGNYVWRDTNANGIQDSFEVGVLGVVVNLYNANNNTLIGSTTTNQNGFYLFDGLNPGDYYLDFELPDGYDSFSPRGAGGDALLDSDADTNTGQTVDFSLASLQTDLSWDAGLIGEGEPASIGDLVWEDLNADGIQDDGEPGIAGVTVTLYQIGVGERGSTTTAADGSYGFTELDPGDYYLVFDQPSGYLQSPANAGADDMDSDAAIIFDGNSSRHRTSFTQLSAGEHDPNWDAGYYRVGTIGDTVWNDADTNGQQNGAEAGIADVTVILTDSDGNVVASTVTDGNGEYLFEDVLAGDYTVSVDPSTLPADLGQTYDLNGPLDDSADVSLPAGGSNLDVDFGYAPNEQLVAEIGDRVWNDLNGDGIQDDGEPGIGGVTVTLYDGDDVEIGSATTLADGSYSFTDLPPRDYYLIFTRPDGYQPSPQDANGNSQDNEDSDAHPDTGRTATTTLSAGENDDSWDAGFVEVSSIGDTVWMDVNSDGIQQNNEVGIQNVTVILTDGGGNEVGTTVTAPNGYYIFTGLSPDDYTVTVDTGSLPPSVAQTYDLDGTLDHETTVTLGAGENINNADFGYQPVGSIGDRVWEDLNADGVQDGGENGIEGVTVILKDADGNTLDTQITDADGIYGFSDLPAGTYTVEVDSSSLPAGFIQTYDLDEDLDHKTIVALAVGEDRDDVDFGYVEPASLGDLVWNDTNGDGIQNGDELGIEGVTVNLLDSDGNVLDSNITDSDGAYSFTGLLPGDYVVEFDHDSAALAGFTASPQDVGDDTLDSDAARDSGRTIIINLEAGEIDNSWDAGFYEGGSIGDYVWLDEDGEGDQDAGEEGIPGVTVILTDGDGNQITTTTDISGTYLFDMLPAGDYTVEIDTSTLPAGVQPTYDLDGGNDHTTSVPSLTQGQDKLDVDFGYENSVPSISIEKTVYLGHDSGASCEGVENVVGENGDAVTYCFQVTNTGNTHLNDITIDDAGLGISVTDMTLLSGDDSQPLAPGDSLVYYYQTTITGDLMSAATAEGEPTNGDGNPTGDDNVTDEDSASVEEVNPAISIQKTVLAGHHETDACQGSELVSGENGDAVTYCYVITNTGDTYLNNFVLEDADFGFTRTISILLPPGGMITGTMQTIIDGDLLSSASVIANPVDEDGEDIPNVDDVNDDDTAEVEEVAPAIELSNTVYALHDDGASCEGSELVAGDLGDAVTYCFVVTNTGDTHLNGIELSDNDLGVNLSSDALLAPGESITLHVESTINGDLVNTAVVTANPVDSNGADLANVDDVSDDDPSEVEKNTPDINLETTVYVGHDDGASCPGGELASGVTGSNVTYCFVVTNTSGEALDNITINDDTLGINEGDMTLLSGDDSQPLAPGATLVYYYETTITNELINTATVTATDEGGDEVSDDDGAEVDEVAPAIELQNTVYAGHSDGSACSGGELVTGYNGDAVTYCFLVTNTGDTHLGTITIDDADLNINLTEEVLLAPGESTMIYYEGTIDGDLLNTATASGNPTDEEGIDLPGVDNPTDDDTSEVDELLCITSIGDTIFLDSDADGQQADNEPGISGVVVNLVGAGADNELGTDDDYDGGSQTTDADGFYSFTGLSAGTYRVDVDESTLPEGYQLTTGNEPMIVEVSECESYEDAHFGYAASVCETSLMYGVFDANTSDTQFFTLDLGTGSAEALGPQYDEYDIEAIEIHPETGILYAVAGGGGDQDGNVFSVDKETGVLTNIGNTGIGADDPNEIVSAAFDPQANLWVFQENVGLYTVDVDTGAASQQWAAAFGDNWEGLAWEPEGNYLYATEGRDLYRWDPANQEAERICGADFLPYETEALDFRFDGKFLGGSDKTNDSSLSIFEIDVDSCQITPTDYDIAYNDVESLTSEACVEEGFVEGTVEGGGRSVAGGVADLNIRLDADLNSDGSYTFSTQTTTDGQGYYSFTNLPSGNYRLSIENSTTEAVEFSLGNGNDFDYEEVNLQAGSTQYKLMLPVIQR